MTALKKTVAVFLIAIIMISLLGCEKEPQHFRHLGSGMYEFIAPETLYGVTISYYRNDSDKRHEVESIAFEYEYGYYDPDMMKGDKVRFSAVLPQAPFELVKIVLKAYLPPLYGDNGEPTMQEVTYTYNP